MTDILIVDDEKSIRISLREFLAADGYTVEVAADAPEALRLLGEHNFDVVVSDIVLPQIDGIELLKAIRGAAPFAQVIMMTGEPTVDSAAEALRSGAFDYLIKPTSKNAVLRSVGNAARVKALDDERRRLEKANTQYRETLEARVMELKQEVERRRLAEQAKGDFVSMVSHDLRTPLAIAKEAIALLSDGVVGDLVPKQHRLLDVAGRNMVRLADLIDDLLDVARLDEGKFSIEKETIDLVELAQQVCTLLELLAAEKKIAVEVCADAATIPVLADRQRTFQVLMNLGSNAVKFTERGSVRIGLSQDGEEVVITVRDTGTGISPEDVPLIFERFPRLKRVYGQGQTGTGLGLSIVKGIVNLHGGTISVSSEEGKGSLFTVRLSRNGAPVSGSDECPCKP